MRRRRPVADRRAAAFAGLLAAVAYGLTMEADLRLTGRAVDDFLLLGRPLARDRRRARALGAGVHLANGVALGLVYASLAEPRLAGPPWVRGLTFATLEQAVLHPLMVFERAHPAIRGGEIASYWTWEAFAQSLPRHAAYGTVLGALYDHWRR